VAARDLLFFDTETTGLAGGTGTRAFMIGAADWHVCPQRGEGLRIRQLLMSTMAAEDAMLATFARWLQPSTVFCSYNGRSYDAPLLRRATGWPASGDPISALDHVDLLYPPAAVIAARWENCKLSTIERQLLRVVREDDLPGSEAPGAWLRFPARRRCGEPAPGGRPQPPGRGDPGPAAAAAGAREQRERETLALVGQ
jgi:uncharacterized protein YprB with RNaseH-like and TPR domain